MMAKSGMSMDVRPFLRSLQIVKAKLEAGVHKATVRVVNDLEREILLQVPKDTDTLAQSFFKEIKKEPTGYSASLGFGGSGDPVNPKTGAPASSYMTEVHEDLEAFHPKGKAKFLEDPIRAQEKKFLRGIRADINSVLK